MTAPLSDEQLDAIRARADAATPGPWYWRNSQDVYLLGERSRAVMTFTRMGMQGAQPQFRGDDGLLVDGGKVNLHAMPDALFIAKARSDVADLLAEVLRLRAVLDGMTDEYRVGVPGGFVYPGTDKQARAILREAPGEWYAEHRRVTEWQEVQP